MLPGGLQGCGGEEQSAGLASMIGGVSNEDGSSGEVDLDAGAGSSCRHGFPSAKADCRRSHDTEQLRVQQVTKAQGLTGQEGFGSPWTWGGCAHLCERARGFA